MIKLVSKYFIHEDDRGGFKGLVNFGQWEEINIIETKANTIRGNHYHRNIRELFIILSGLIEVTAKRVISEDELSDEEKIMVREGDVFVIEPMVNHTFKVLHDSVWINVLSKRINKDAPDIWRIGKR
jgi:dTDP-4-dehydrorhamnose 3,5-epimerase-like enzyme